MDLEEELDDERAEELNELRQKVGDLQSALEVEQSRRVNLDRENRELKSFVAVHCANNSSNAMSRVYADPLLGFELSYFRERYLGVLAAADLAPGASPLGKINALETQIKELTLRVENPAQQNAHKLLRLKDAEITDLKRALDEANGRTAALGKAKEEQAARLFVLQKQQASKPALSKGQ
jgi:hypothetical protein